MNVWKTLETYVLDELQSNMVLQRFEKFLYRMHTEALDVTTDVIILLQPLFINRFENYETGKV